MKAEYLHLIMIRLTNGNDIQNQIFDFKGFISQ